MNLILVGLRGSGKTTVGRMVAARLGRPFLDLDDVVARSLGAATVAEAWRAHGQAGFREAETRALRDVLMIDSRVVALGGGTPTAPGTADLLREARERTVIVYLVASAAALRVRLATTDISSRPSLTGADPLAEIEIVLAGRDPLFRELADAVVETDEKSVEEVAERVAALAGAV